MAAIGFAVGLGNIWRFPYVTGENGGGAFVAVYLLCAVVIGVPILIAEIMVGRRGGLTPPSSMAVVARESQRASTWSFVGYVNLATAYLIVIAYAVVAGWVLFYLSEALTGGLAALNATSSSAKFAVLLTDVPELVLWTTGILILAGGIIYNGVQQGIERVVVVLMPMLFLLLLGLAFYNAVAGGMPQALAYLLQPDFSKVNGAMFLAALGQAFFSIGVAMAGMMMFGAYLPRSVSITKSAFIIVAADTSVALVAGLVIFPMVFANGLDPAGGPGLIFQTLPVAFAQIPGGRVVGSCFFLLLSVAAITSVVGLSEPLAAYLSERFQWSRQRAAIVLVVLTVLGSLVSVLSYNHWAGVTVLGATLADAIDFVPNQVLLPLGGLLIAGFVGWRMQSQQAFDALALRERTFAVWRNVLKFIAVPAVAVILVTGIVG